MKGAIGYVLGAVGVCISCLLALSACVEESTGSTKSSVSVPNTGAQYVVLTDWTRIPANNDSTGDIMVRTIKIENVCYLQTASVKDWMYSVVPTGATCQAS